MMRKSFLIYLMLLLFLNAQVSIAASPTLSMLSAESDPDKAFDPKQDRKNRQTLLSFFKQKNYFSAQIKQVTFDGENENTQEGTLHFSKPNSFVFKLTGADAQTVISDGKKIWRYYPNLDQVLIASLENNRNNIPLLLLGNRAEQLLNSFNVVLLSLIDKKATYRLYPINYESFDYVDIQIQERLFLNMTIYYSSKHWVKVIFSNWSEGSINKDTFKFTIPKGTEIIQE